MIGTFNDWDAADDPKNPEDRGYWYADVEGVNVGDHYRYQLTTQAGVINRIDPYALEVTNSVGSAIVHDPCFDWEGDDFSLAECNQLVIYELPVGTFNDDDPKGASRAWHRAPDGMGPR